MSVESAKQQTQRKSRSKKKRKVNYKKIILVAILSIMLIGVALVAFIGITLAKNYELDESMLDMMEGSKIYDNQGNEIGQLFKEDREYVPLSEMPPLLVSAFVAVEDQRFYEHRGIDLRAIGRALYRDIIARSKVEGGSTITQQLVKNVFLSPEKTLMRKTEEAVIAINLEQRYTKDEILEMYLNYIWFGEGAHGIQAASKRYFGKDDLHDLTLEEIATLVALPRGPGIYSPLHEKNEERALQRRQVVLRVMYNQGLITDTEREYAAHAELELNHAGRVRNPAISTYVDMLLQEAEEKFGITMDEIMTGGYEIHTAMDLNAQEIMYEAIREDGPYADSLFPEPGPEHFVQGSMVILDHQTGGVIAVLGGRDYVRQGTNRAVADVRSPGSSIKPLTVYTPALEAGSHPYDLLKDEPMTFPGGYSPRNVTGNFKGQVTMMNALKDSDNVPAVWLLDQIGRSKGVEAAKRFGLEDVPDELGIALGGGIGTSPMTMAKAFSTFPNHGVMMEPYLIEKIVDRQGDVVASNDLEFTQVTQAQHSWYMHRMLEEAVKNGTGRNAQFNHPVAGKTGTVQDDDYPGNRDAWFVGYTPYYTAAVWMGYDRRDANHAMNTSGGNHPARLFQHVMSRMHEGYEVKQFQRPEGVQELEPPVDMEQITDLKAYLTLNADFSFTVDLEFTPNSDDRVAYNIYKIDKESDQRTVIGEMVTKNELIGGRGWKDSDVKLSNLYAYEVEPVNTVNNTPGQISNRATVEVFPTYPFFRKADDIDENAFEKWIRQLLGKDEEDDEEDDEKEDKDKKDKDKKKKEDDDDDGNGNGGGEGDDEDNEDDDDEDDEDDEDEGETGGIGRIIP